MSHIGIGIATYNLSCIFIYAGFEFFDGHFSRRPYAPPITARSVATKNIFERRL